MSSRSAGAECNPSRSYGAPGTKPSRLLNIRLLRSFQTSLPLLTRGLLTHLFSRRRVSCVAAQTQQPIDLFHLVVVANNLFQHVEEAHSSPFDGALHEVSSRTVRLSFHQIISRFGQSAISIGAAADGAA